MEIYCDNCGTHVITVHPGTRRSPLTPSPTDTEAVPLDKYLELWLYDFPWGGRQRPTDIAASFNYWAEVNGLESFGQRSITTALLRRGAHWVNTGKGRAYYLPSHVSLDLPLTRPGDQIVPRVRDKRMKQGIHPNLPLDVLRDWLRQLDYTAPAPVPHAGDEPRPD